MYKEIKVGPSGTVVEDNKFHDGSHNKEAIRPCYMENFEARCRNFCLRDISREFREDELKAIVMDYLNVVYRKQWKGDKRYKLHEQKIGELQAEIDHRDSAISRMRAELEEARKDLKSMWYYQFKMWIRRWLESLKR